MFSAAPSTPPGGLREQQAAGRGTRSLSLLLSGESPEFTPPAGMRRLAEIFWSESRGHVSTLGPYLARHKSVRAGA